MHRSMDAKNTVVYIVAAAGLDIFAKHICAG
jgi:hypothetical protein